MPVTPEFAVEVLRRFAGDDTGADADDLWWRTDGEYAPATFWVKCGDQFYWGCADLEELTPENLGTLDAAVADCRAVDPVVGGSYAAMLFCCRVRGMRPQGAAYPDDRRFWELLDACGPRREPGLGNPRPHPREAA